MVIFGDPVRRHDDTPRHVRCIQRAVLETRPTVVDVSCPDKKKRRTDGRAHASNYSKTSSCCGRTRTTFFESYRASGSRANRSPIPNCPAGKLQENQKRPSAKIYMRGLYEGIRSIVSLFDSPEWPRNISSSSSESELSQ